jgi:hypothetical protein
MHKVTPQRLQQKMMTGSKKGKANTSCVSTKITSNAGTMNRNFTVRSAKVNNTWILQSYMMQRTYLKEGVHTEV